jgi:hypothetical protein
MTHLADVRSDPASPPPVSGGTRGLLRWVCTSNPFYVLSALLVCLGLWVSFGGQVVAAQTWALLSGMAGYTLLLAVTACLLVRFVGVWDDVRTVLLLVVLMFLATSVTFDEVLARDPQRGVICFLGGLLFAVAVSEGMLRGMPLTLPSLFRVPYYLILALFFLYPVAITPLLDQPRSESLFWSLFGFSPAAGLVALTLVPAARRGRDYVRDNGSPWRWAWYPWTLFGLLGLAVPARSALLCWSMHHVASGSTEPYIFGPYFLAPFLLGVGVLLLEIGLVERLKGVLVAAMSLPAVLVALALVAHRPEEFYQVFLAQFTTRLGGTPLYLTLIASATFYAYAALRRVPAATEALSAALAGLAIVAPQTLDLDAMVSPRPLPILAVAILQLGLGLRKRVAWRCLVGACFLAAFATIGLPGTGSGAHRGPVAFHLILVAILILGAVFNDSLGRLLRTLGAATALVGCLVVLSGRLGRIEAVPAWAMEVYPLVIAATIAGYGLMLHHRTSLMIAGITLSSWLVVLGWRGYSSARQVVAGLDYLAIGMILFALAVLTSVFKGGVMPRGFGVRKGKLPDSVD